MNQPKKQKVGNAGGLGTAQPSQALQVTSQNAPKVHHHLSHDLMFEKLMPNQVSQVTSQNAPKVCRHISYGLMFEKLMITKTSGKQNPIYLFHELVIVNKKGEVGEEGDKHYKCYHSN